MIKRILTAASVIFLMFIISYANSGMAADKKAPAATANNYIQFYNIIKNNVSSQANSFSINCKNYSNSVYNADKALAQVIKDYFSKNYDISSYTIGYSYKKGSRNRTLFFRINYKTVDGHINSYNDLINLINDKIGSKPGKVVLKIFRNNTQVFNKLSYIKDDINQNLKDDIKISSISASTLNFSGSEITLLTLNLKYFIGRPSESTTASFIVNNDDDLYRTLKAAIDNVDSNVNITFKNNYLEFDMNKIDDKIDELSNTIQNKLAGPDYIDTIKTELSTRSSASGVESCNAVVTISYKLPRETILKQASELNEKAVSIIKSIIKPGMSAFQKELTIHNYIVNSCRYDYENLLSSTIPAESYTAYGVLVLGVGVCEGYSNAMNLLLNMAGLDCRIITGTAGGQDHAWNIVKLDDGNYYQVDVTWDDPITPSGKQILSYDYFNLTDAQMSRDHTWNKALYPECSATKYRYTGN